MTMKLIPDSDLYPSQLLKLWAVQEYHPMVAIIKCSDENTGRKFGSRAKRAGKCCKIGSGGRNKGQTGYQIWASWATCDLMLGQEK